MGEGLDLFRVRRELKGDARRLFFYLSKRISGYTIEEIKYLSGFSNKALINRCLAEMKRLGIVERQGDRYYVPRPIAEAVSFAFKHYAKIGNKLIARGFVSAIAYAVFLLILVVAYGPATSTLPLGLAFTLILMAIGVYEALRMRSLAKALRAS
jgi:hypothetical protein